MRLSASVVLLRRQHNVVNTSLPGNGFQILFVQRSKSISSPGMYTFPGGVYEDNSDSKCLRKTALRELFEETGILFGTTTTIGENDPKVNKDIVNSERIKLRESDNVRFDNFLNKYDIKIETTLRSMRHFTTFITPDFAKPKFITPFFLIDISDDGSCCDYMKADLTETASLEWLTPSEAISLNNSGDIKYLPPQAYILHILNKHETTSEVSELFTETEVSDVNINNVLSVKDERGFHPIKPFKLPADETKVELNSDGKSKSAILAYPGDEKHNQYPGDCGALHRMHCQLPMGRGFSLQSSYF